MELYVENDEQFISDDRNTTQGVEGQIELHQATFLEFWLKWSSTDIDDSHR